MHVSLYTCLLSFLLWRLQRGKKLTKAPGTDTHPLAPKKPLAPTADAEPMKLMPFSVRLDPQLLRQMKIAVATHGITLQAATAEAFELWLDQISSDQ